MSRPKNRMRLMAGVLAGIAIGTVLVVPAGAHIGRPVHLWNKHLLKLAVKSFYTKAAADARFLSPAAADAQFLTPTEGDAQFLTPTEGDVRYSQVAYAEVLGTVVVAANSKNIAQGNVSNPEPGIFCFSGLPFIPRSAVATFMAFGGVIQTRLADGLTSACTGAQAEVLTTNSGGFFANVSFMILLHG